MIKQGFFLFLFFQISVLCASSSKQQEILFIMPRLPLGGGERAFVSMLNVLPIADAKMDVCILKRGDPFEKFIRRKVNFVTLEEAKKKEYRIAVSFAEWMTPKKWVGVIHAKKKVQWIHIDLRAGAQGSWIQAFTNAKDCRGIDHFVCVSEDAKKGFIALHPNLAHKVSVIYNIIDNELIQAQGTAQATEFETDTSFKVVTVARLHPQKALERCIAVHKRLEDAGIHFHWYVVGSGTEEAKLTECIRKNQMEGKFILLGGKENPFPYIKKADLFALLSYYEGFGLVVTEAKILGKPIIVTNFAGAKEQIVSGVNGLIVDNTEDAIYKGMQCVISDSMLRKKYAGTLENFAYDNRSSLTALKSILK